MDTIYRYPRFLQPTYLQTIGLSLVSGSVATLITHPLQFLKTVIQYRTQGINRNANKIHGIAFQSKSIFRQLCINKLRSAGIFQLYRGLQINMMSKLSYLTIRNFMYKAIYDIVEPSKNDLENTKKVMLAGFCGGFAAYCTSPFTLLTIRQILDSQLKPEMRRYYNDPQMALSELKNKKILFKGSQINALRHFMLNVTIAAPYNIIVEVLQDQFGYSRMISPIALVVSSFLSSIVTIPLDNIRTRVMQSHQVPEKNRVKYCYQSTIDVVRKAIKYEGGVRNLWAGFYAYYFGILVYATLTSGVTSFFTDQMKRKKTLENWQI